MDQEQETPLDLSLNSGRSAIRRDLRPTDGASNGIVASGPHCY